MSTRGFPGAYSASNLSVASFCESFKINRKLRLHIIWDPVTEHVSIKDKNAVIVGLKHDNSYAEFEVWRNDERRRKFDEALRGTVNHVNRDVKFCELGTWRGLKHRPRGILVNTRALHNSIANRLLDDFRRVYNAEPPSDDPLFHESLVFSYLVAKLVKNYYAVATGRVASDLNDAEAPAVTVIFHDVQSAPALVSLRNDSFFDEMCCIYAAYRPYVVDWIMRSPKKEEFPSSPDALEELAIKEGVHHIMKIEQRAALLADRLCSMSDAPDKVMQRLLIRPINLHLSKKNKARKRICV